MLVTGYDLKNLTEEQALKESDSRENGIEGLKNTGVYSHADIEANMIGRKMYRDFEASIKDGTEYKFMLPEESAAKLNENNNKNEYREGLKKAIEKNEKEQEK